jgi:hypothetical protein
MPFTDNKVAESENITEKEARADPIIYVVTAQRWAQLQNDVNTFFLLFMGICVFIMQLGFPMLEAGLFCVCVGLCGFVCMFVWVEIE